jgi:hypothetical protein
MFCVRSLREKVPVLCFVQPQGLRCPEKNILVAKTYMLYLGVRQPWPDAQALFFGDLMKDSCYSCHVCAACTTAFISHIAVVLRTQSVKNLDK